MKNSFQKCIFSTILLSQILFIQTAKSQAQYGYDSTLCAGLTDVQLFDIGYLSVTYSGYKAGAQAADRNGTNDSTAAIQEAIDFASQNKLAVYFPLGTYKISDTLVVRQEEHKTNDNGDFERYGNLLVGSYCHTQGIRPTIRLADGTDPNPDDSIPVETSGKTPALLLMRNTANGNNTTPLESDSSHDWHQIVRNLHIELGNNTGAVGIWHRGAEGSSLQDVSIDAGVGFAGLHYINSSGGYTYNVEIDKGKYGIYTDKQLINGATSPRSVIQGGSTLIAGITLKNQSDTPIIFNHFGPLTIVGFDITHDDGRIISTNVESDNSNIPIRKLEPNTTHDSAGHVAFVDGKISITANASAPIIDNVDRSVYFKNVFVKGSSIVLENEQGGNLITSSSDWYHINEYAYSGNYSDPVSSYGEESKLIKGYATDDVYYDGGLFPQGNDVTVNNKLDPPMDLLSQHFYKNGLCNVDEKDVIFVNKLPYTANPNDLNGDDTVTIQKAITDAGSGGIVFLPAGKWNPRVGNTPGYVGAYKISNTLSLPSDVTLCGVTNYSSTLDASDTSWTLDTNNKPVIKTALDGADATTAIADFGIKVPVPNEPDPVNPDPKTGDGGYIYSIHWTAGRNSIFRDVFDRSEFGNPRDRIMVQITGNGGGRWYGLTQHVGHPFGMSDPILANAPPPNGNGALLYNPKSRHLEINGTSESLTFYPFHYQHLTPPNDLLNGIMGSQCDITNSSNVTLYGIKTETAADTDKSTAMISHDNNEGLIPSGMTIKNSSNISLIGYEGSAQHEEGGALINIINSTNITIANMGRREKFDENSDPKTPKTADSEDKWFFVKENFEGITNKVKARGFLSLFKSEECFYYHIGRQVNGALKTEIMCL